MRILVAVIGLVVLIGSPVAAQSFDPSVGTGNVARPYFAQPQNPTGFGNGSLRGAYLYASPRRHHRANRHRR